MRTTILAACAALLTFMASPAFSHPSNDDRYFDSRAHAAPAKVKHRRATHSPRIARSGPKVKAVVSRRLIQPHGRITLTSADEQHQNRRETIQYNSRINSSATFPTVTKAVVLGGRPAGCPARFCGCGASLEVFGKIIPFLNLAANWLRFPRAEPAPGMVAARRGHVFVLKQRLSGKTWLVHDSNSGRRLTRLHPRSIAGYTIVNPRAGPS